MGYGEDQVREYLQSACSRACVVRALRVSNTHQTCLGSGTVTGPKAGCRVAKCAAGLTLWALLLQSPLLPVVAMAGQKLAFQNQEKSFRLSGRGGLETQRTKQGSLEPSLEREEGEGTVLRETE